MPGPAQERPRAQRLTDIEPQAAKVSLLYHLNAVSVQIKLFTTNIRYFFFYVGDAFCEYKE